MVYEEPADVWFSEDDDIPFVDPWESIMKRYENERKEKAQRASKPKSSLDNNHSHTKPELETKNNNK